MPQRTRLAALTLALIAPLVLGSCDGDPAEPERGYTLRIQAGDDQLSGFGAQLENPLQVVIEDANTGSPGSGILVRWSVVTGGGALLGSQTTTADVNGVASNTLTLGPTDPQYEVRATVTDQIGPATTFSAIAVHPAVVDFVSPTSANAGDTVAIHGSAFAAAAQNNTVLIAGLRAVLVSATPTQLRVVVPLCVPTRAAEVRVFLGNVASNAATLNVTGNGAAPIAMDVGDVLYLADAAAASCLRLPGNVGTRYLLLLQNAAEIAGRPLSYRLSGALDGALVSADRTFDPDMARSSYARMDGAGTAQGPQAVLDSILREAEREALENAPSFGPRAAPPATALQVEVGERRDFWVFRSAGNYARITAEVRHVSDHAILYQDLDAPAGGFAAGDFQAFGAVFDDPIHDTMTGVFGAPSDGDGNDRVIILFTPVVNRLTPPGSGSAFVAGFFFGIDLLENQAHGNDAEVFYTLVPDPQGQFGNVRTFDQILQGVPPVMAHEFQHMIHFNQRVLLRGGSLEATWLSEALAHAAEELIGDEYRARGDETRAFDFKIQNFLRAEAFLENPEVVSPLGPAVPLPVRGAAWLLLEYLQGHFGGNALLTALTQTTATSVANVTARTGLPWGTVLARWGVAIWADGAEPPGLDPVYTFPSLDLRAVYANPGFPLLPLPLAFEDFSRVGTLPSGGSAFWLLEPGASTLPLNVSVAGRNAPLGATDRPQLTLLRIE